MTWWLLAWLGLVGVSAASPLEKAEVAELERLRARVADQVQLSAYDLVDELVWTWTHDPVFPDPTPVVLAGVTVPVGLGTGMQALLENHIAHVIGQNPSANVQLVHCPACTAVVVRSGPEGTLVARGVDQPEVLAELGARTGQHALFVDVEAEGAWLVLRARITRLTPDLPIVWSHTLATSTSSPALLRDGSDLKSAADARDEYLRALRERGPVFIPLRLAVKTYARNQGFGGVPAPPFAWLQTGIELAPTQGRAWTGSVLVGYSFVPQAYQGIMAQGRVNRLLTGRVRSTVRPDVYLFGGVAVTSVWGPATASFRRELVTADDILQDQDLEGPRTSFGSLQLGLELRLGSRLGFSTYLEMLPDLVRSQNIGHYVRVFGTEWQCLGSEVSFWF